MLEKVKPYIPVLFVSSLELGLQVLLIVVQNHDVFLFFTYLFVHGVLLTTLVIFVLRSSFVFKRTFRRELFNVMILCLVTAFTWYFETNRTSIEFFLFRDQMQVVADLGKKDSLVVQKAEYGYGWGFQRVQVPKAYWAVDSANTLATRGGENFLIYFPRNRFFQDCGFVYSVSDQPPYKSSYLETENEMIIRAYFDRLETNWFYGCFRYD
jgi:hypothetical protein